MEQPAVRFENVSKRFDFSAQKPRSVLESFISIFPVQGSSSDQPEKADDFWALRDVTFDVMPGQGFGIIGRNGSGKSTALKLVARILKPNRGRILVNGRVSALLELGAGFHHDLTGRENIFLNAAVLGLQEDEVNARFDDIVEFSELDSFIDMPVKHYSSGMYMRLGFSIAIHVQPDILIVDEILAVGDQAFQSKCLDKILWLKKQGTTILMVSHNLNQLRTICTDMVWMEKGQVKAAGKTESVISQYVAFSYQGKARDNTAVNFERIGDQAIELTAVRFLDKKGKETKTFLTGDSLTIEMKYVAHKAVPNPEFGLAIYREDGVHVSGPNTQMAEIDLGTVEGEGLIQYKIENIPLLPARYKVTTAVHDSRFPHCYDLHKDAYSFKILPGGTQEINGILQLDASWKMCKTPVPAPIEVQP